ARRRDVYWAKAQRKPARPGPCSGADGRRIISLPNAAFTMSWTERHGAGALPVGTGSMRAAPATGTQRFNWRPLAILAGAQVLLVCNVATLKISIEGIVRAFETSSGAVKTAIIMYSLMAAASILASTRLSIIV